MGLSVTDCNADSLLNTYSAEEFGIPEISVTSGDDKVYLKDGKLLVGIDPGVVVYDFWAGIFSAIVFVETRACGNFGLSATTELLKGEKVIPGVAMGAELDFHFFKASAGFMPRVGYEVSGKVGVNFTFVAGAKTTVYVSHTADNPLDSSLIITPRRKLLEVSAEAELEAKVYVRPAIELVWGNPQKKCISKTTVNDGALKLGVDAEFGLKATGTLTATNTKSELCLKAGFYGDATAQVIPPLKVIDCVELTAKIIDPAPFFDECWPIAGGPTCSNGLCETGESCASCPDDCPCEVQCPNGSCSDGETCSNCQADCGVCPQQPPTAPTISAPAFGEVDQDLNVVVTAGVDPEGSTVKVQCTSVGSNYSTTAFDSAFVAGGQTVDATFNWSSAGIKNIFCVSFDQGGVGSLVASAVIQITPKSGMPDNNPPTAPTISLPASGNVNQAISVSVTKGTDPDGNQVKVQCTSVGSNYDGTAYDSGLGSGGVTVTPSFTWTTAGTKTVYCTTFDQNGAASSTPSKTITINSVNNPPTAPTISLPASGNVNQAISVSVTKGTDPDGNQVKVQCTSVGSNYDGTAYDSGLGSGGVTVTPSFTWTTAGTKTVYCTTFDQNGAASSTPSKTITINSVNNPPTAPTISLPASGNVNQAISVSVTKGTDPDGNQVKVQCTSVGSNYDGTAYDSGLGSGGVTVTPSFTWTTAGTKTVYCTTFDQNGAASSTPSKTITINSVNNPPTAPTISLPASGNVNQAISVSGHQRDRPGRQSGQGAMHLGRVQL
ncbi:MAG: hypothetical protein IPK82_23795 [Polyangiaceae bacterium]|nr:hypothetical protein [Polyangiaceae bacterium]